MPDAGTLWLDVRPDVSGFSQDLNKALEPASKSASQKLNAFGSKLSSAGKKMSLGITAPIVAGFALAGNAASDLGEAVNATRVTFGEHAASVESWSKRTADAMGIARTDALTAAAGFGNMFRSSGLAADASADMSKRMVQLAADMGSLHNQDPTEMLDKIRSGLAGEAEPLRRFGVLLSDAAINAEAMGIGLVKPTKNLAEIRAAQVAAEKAQLAYNAAVKKHGEGSLEARSAMVALEAANGKLAKATAGSKVELTDAQKVQARYSLMLRQTSTAHGDFARTADSVANATRRTSAVAKDSAGTFGQALQPVMQAGIGIVSKLAGAFGSMGGGMQTAILIGGGLLAALGPIITVAGNVAKAIAFLSVQTTIFGMTMNRALLLSGIGALIAFAIAIVIFRKQIFGALQAIGRFFVNVFEGVWRFLKKWGPLILAAMMGPLGLITLAVIKWRDKIIGFFKGIGKGIVEVLKAGLNLVIDLLERGINLALAPARRLSRAPIIGRAIPDVPVIKIPRLHEADALIDLPRTEERLAILRGQEIVRDVRDESAGGVVWTGDLIVQGHVLTDRDLRDLMRQSLSDFARRGGVIPGITTR